MEEDGLKEMDELHKSRTKYWDEQYSLFSQALRLGSFTKDAKNHIHFINFKEHRKVQL